MATTFERKSAFQSIADEQLGFRLGEPLRASEKSLNVVVPIIRETHLSRQYVTFPEVTDQIDVRDTGRIDRFTIKNPTDDHVYIRYGTIFKGSTQERAILRSAMVFAKSSAHIEVRCVHASRGISANAKVRYGGVTPHNLDRMNYTANMGTENAAQHNYWSNIATYSRTMSFTINSTALRGQASGSRRTKGGSGETPRAFLGSVRVASAGVPDVENEDFVVSDDLAGNIDTFSKSFDDVIRSVERKENQTGFALITTAGVETVESFDSPLSWKAIHEDAVKRVGLNLVDQKALSAFEYNHEKAKQAIKATLALPFDEKTIWEHKPANGEPHVLIVGLSAKGYTGEVVEVDHRVIHFCIFKTA